jgi:hypothetical protein
LAKLEATLALPSWQVTQDAALFAELLSVRTGEGKPFVTLRQPRRKEFLLERVVDGSAVSLASNAPRRVALAEGTLFAVGLFAGGAPIACLHIVTGR